MRCVADACRDFATDNQANVANVIFGHTCSDNGTDFAITLNCDTQRYFSFGADVSSKDGGAFLRAHAEGLMSGRDCALVPQIEWDASKQCALPIGIAVVLTTGATLGAVSALEVF